MKEISVTMDMLTSFEQRRLIKHQVKSGLYVSPFDKKNKKKKGDKDGYSDDEEWNSDKNDSSSDEDFAYLEKQLQGG